MVNQCRRMASSTSGCRRAFSRDGRSFSARRRARQEGDAEQGREQHGRHPRDQQCRGDDGEQREGIFAGRAVVQPDRHEARHGDQGAGQHGEGRRAVGEGGGALERVAGLAPGDHHLDRDHGVVDQQAERDDQRAERDALQGDAGKLHEDEGRGQHQRDGDGDHQPGAQAEAQEADRQHDHHGLEQGAREAADRLVDDRRLVGDEMHADADRQLADDPAPCGRAGPCRTRSGCCWPSCRWQGRSPAGR